MEWVLDGNQLLITGQGEMIDYSSSDDTPWSSERDQISTVIFDEGVKSVGDYAFAECESLRTIIFLGDAPEIGGLSFYLVAAATYYPDGNVTYSNEYKLIEGAGLGWSSISNMYSTSIMLDEGFDNSIVSDETMDTRTYWEIEADRVVGELKEKITNHSFTFLLASDVHNMAVSEAKDANVLRLVRQSSVHAASAMNRIAEQVDIDFFANLGDIAWGSNETTIEQGIESIEQVKQDENELLSKDNSWLLPGNHDSLTYSFEQNRDYLSDEQISEMIGSYQYTDFDNQKIRVICLNTSETSDLEINENVSAENISAEQLQWFAETLDLSDKADSSSWGIVILSHHPLDWGNIIPAANLLQAYLTGDEYIVEHHGQTVSYNFSGRNDAVVIAQFHGHVHAYTVDYIHYLSNEGEAIPTSVQRIAIPNVNFYRNNEYGLNGKEEYYGIEFGQSETYYKVADSSKDTSFTAVTIDLVTSTIYAQNYGAGIDRVIQFNGELRDTYSLEMKLSDWSQQIKRI